MSTFPALKSGSVMQFPAPVISGQGVGVIRFLDGTHQRYLTQGRSYRSWRIDLSLLDEDELGSLEQFYAAQAGDFGTFQFPDPFSGNLIPNCRFAHPTLQTQYEDVDNGSASLWVIETNG